MNENFCNIYEDVAGKCVCFGFLLLLISNHEHGLAKGAPAYYAIKWFLIGFGMLFVPFVISLTSSCFPEGLCENPRAGPFHLLYSVPLDSLFIMFNQLQIDTASGITYCGVFLILLSHYDFLIRS
jgi:hypothetical protein